MANIITGTVSRLSEKDWQGRNGNITLHSFQIEGSNRWFRTGTTRPPFNQGAGISFVVDGKGNVDMETVQSVTTGAIPAPAARDVAAQRGGQSRSGGTRQAASGGARNDYWEEKDRFYKEEEIPKISLVAARDTAVRLVSAALSADALSFKGATVGKKLDMLLAYVDQVRDRFLLDTMNAKHIIADLLENQENGNSSDDSDEHYVDNSNDREEWE